MNELTWSILRQIMYQPSAVWLATENCGDRWLHDQWVMLDVTGHIKFEGLPDGAYRLMSQGEEVRSRNSIPPADLEVWFAGLDGLWWHEARPTQWSVAEHPGKAMLWVTRKGPCLFGEPTWTAVQRLSPDCEVSYMKERNLFRFNEPGREPFCYAAGIRCPEGQENIALAISDLTQHATWSSLSLKSTSNEGEGDGDSSNE